MIYVYIRIYRAAAQQINAIKAGRRTDIRSSDGQLLSMRIHRGGYRDGSKSFSDLKSFTNKKDVPLMPNLLRNYSVVNSANEYRIDEVKRKKLSFVSTENEELLEIVTFYRKHFAEHQLEIKNDKKISRLLFKYKPHDLDGKKLDLLKKEIKILNIFF